MLLPVGLPTLPRSPHRLAGDGSRIKPRFAAAGSNQPVAKTILFVTPERPMLKGGLGVVSETIPMLLNTYQGRDVRVIQPYLKTTAQTDAQLPLEERFKNTGMYVIRHGASGNRERFYLLQRFDPDNHTWVYAIQNDHYFGQHENTYFPPDFEAPTPASKRALGEDGIFRANMMFDRLVATFTPLLQPGNERPKGVHFDPQKMETPLKLFDESLDALFVNDWMTGPVLTELPKGFGVARVSMLHNTYNQERPLSVARQNHLKIPAYAQTQYSPLETLIEEGDVILADPNYVNTLTRGVGKTSAAWARPLNQRISQGRVMGVHHMPDQRFNPLNNPFLQASGFCDYLNYLRDHVCQLSQASRDQKRDQWKKANKLNMQQQLGLKQDEHAVLLSWAARFDPFQKGFFMMMETLKEFMLAHPDAQVLIAGPDPENPKARRLISQFLRQMEGDSALKGRFALRGRMTPQEMAQLYAASDVVMNPSVYEPYGQTQLEAMLNGAIPFVHPVDGFRSSVLDPEVIEPDALCPPAKYGQTGVMMAPLSNPSFYRKALAHLIELQSSGQDINKGLTMEEAQILAEAKTKCAAGLKRAYRIARDPAQAMQIRENAWRYVTQEHSAPKISEKYAIAVDKAVEVAQQRARKEKTRPSVRFAAL